MECSSEYGWNEALKSNCTGDLKIKYFLLISYKYTQEIVQR